MGKAKDYTGQRFGRLVVIERLPQDPYTKAKYKCQCDCGKLTIVNSSNLATGHSTSCGCIVTKHGFARKERLYNIWVGMRQRCRDKNSNDYIKYDGRGITICDEWEEYIQFKQWASSNCRWANSTEQANNQRNNHLITFKGKTQTIKQWSSELDISNITLLTRLNRGWSITKALTTPTQKGV
ncbi:TPA: hypothetical protein ACUJK1_001013 [Streptococcus agalactiae]|uniref:hypothetical protein n=1 Tax=Streptococcus agalactiae TaxID=1311 RepID=UPI0005A65E1B|nr:hypothetical protein [Streptococcus agalactiae]HEN2245526.1 hypothetical protein [Streptococcus agalactiae]HEN3160605.1 hypothetical protein [Streptococcus agalactiae]HEN3166951.1 hypothetical protein [Streptococcus agalactiae]HEN3213686.1 hypothetical protein [Streptococcus agalactiae]HEN5752745.1 hypothetical protein [Streptococcus agalactiae]